MKIYIHVQIATAENWKQRTLLYTANISKFIPLGSCRTFELYAEEDYQTIKGKLSPNNPKRYYFYLLTTQVTTLTTNHYHTNLMRLISSRAVQ